MKTKTLDRNVIQFYKGKQRKTFSKLIFSKCHHHSESKWRGLCKSSPPWPALSLTLNPNAKPSEGRKTRLQCKDLNQREGRKEEAVESSEVVRLVTDVRERRVEAHGYMLGQEDHSHWRSDSPGCPQDLPSRCTASPSVLQIPGLVTNVICL